MKRVRVIGLVGRSRVGKDTVADYILSKYRCYLKVRLAQPIKDAVCALYGFTFQQIEGPEKEEHDPKWDITPRQAMVHMTQTTMNLMGHDFFTRRLFDHYTTQSIIIPDVRYEHDIHKIHSLGGIVIKIERPNNPIQHDFEKKIDVIQGDYTIRNQGTLEDLYQQIDTIFKGF
jgi:hypothetical protein